MIPPHAGMVWVPPQWRQRRDGYVFVPRPLAISVGLASQIVPRLPQATPHPCALARFVDRTSRNNCRSSSQDEASELNNP
jgi:hypothetical protein